MAIALIVLYNLLIVLLFTYNLGQLSLIVRYIAARRRGKPERMLAPAVPVDWPSVTVQLPVYNERYVVERLIDAVAALQYPADKLQIQVLDDSTDESVALIAARVAYHQQRGVAIQHIRRSNRAGYKAGALAQGLTSATGDFVAIFDADFVPPTDFLYQTVPHFLDPHIGAVQTRWTYLNRNYSLLTQIQGFGLDAHFFVEQRGRNATGLLINFNGTGGIWRKATILDAGGWQPDTLTEDLDLSYRAQLRGWRFVYREDVGSPGELPVTMAALRSQQYRWMKGAAECVRKLARPLLASPKVSLSAKMHGLLHLLSSSMFGLLLLLSVLSVPMAAMPSPAGGWSYGLRNLLQVNLFIMILLYGIPFWQVQAGNNSGWIKRLLHFLRLFFLYPTLMLGLSLYNTVAVVDGYLGRKTPFVRTPKFDLTGSDWRTNVYHQQRLPGIIWAEGVLLLYFLIGMGLDLYWQHYGALPLHTLLVTGYGLVVGYSLVQSARPRLPGPPQKAPNFTFAEEAPALAVYTDSRTASWAD